MYKKRFKKWNFRKRAYRKSPPCSTAPTPRGVRENTACHEVDVEEVQRDYVSHSKSLPPQPSHLEPYASLELVLDSVLAWSCGKLDSHRPASDPMFQYLANPSQPPIQDSRTMYRTFELVFDLWRHGRGDLAGMAARKGFLVLEFVLTEDHPDLVWHVLDTIYDMADHGHLQLLGLFIEHTSVLAHRQLPANHPLLRIIQQLQKCHHQTDHGRQHVCYLLRQAWLRNVHLLAGLADSPTPQRLWLYEQLIWDARTRLRRESGLARNRPAMIKGLEQLLTEQNANRISPDSERLRIEALILEFTQMDLRDRREAEQLARRMLERTESPTGARSNARFHAYARKMLARLCQERQDWDNAEENLRWAVTKREAAHGTNSNLRVVRDMWVLAAHYQNTGRPAKANQTAQDAIARAQQYLEDVRG